MNAETSTDSAATALLAGRVALVCGATGLIGSAIARAFATHGARVVVQYHRSEARARELAQALGLDLSDQVFRADLTGEAETRDLLGRVEARNGRVSVVANCIHGAAEPKPAADLDWSDWAVHFDALRAHVNLCRAAILQLRRGGGALVFVSGALAVRYHEGCAAYSTVKAGLEAYSRTLALEEGKAGVTVNIISPGLVRNPAVAEPPTVAGFEKLDAMSRARLALPTEPDADDIASAAVFLASAMGAQVTGQTIFLTGGEVMRP